jgi:hypothetical protein
MVKVVNNHILYLKSCTISNYYLYSPDGCLSLNTDRVLFLLHNSFN